MPYTPYHFGPSLCVALLFKKYIDLPVFVLVNIVIDLEPLIVGLRHGERIPTHTYCHTFLIGALVALAWAVIAYLGKGILRRLMHFLNLPYKTNFPKMLISSVLGVWFHILLDALATSCIYPFFPLKGNPFFGLLSRSAVLWLCILSFIPALLLYISQRRSVS